jgi:hypothetical protein
MIQLIYILIKIILPRRDLIFRANTYSFLLFRMADSFAGRFVVCVSSNDLVLKLGQWCNNWPCVNFKIRVTLRMILLLTRSERLLSLYNVDLDL